MKTGFENIRGIASASLLILLSLQLSYDAAAATLRFVPQTIKQPTGEVIHCFVSGDEYFNWLHDQEGFTIVLDEKGFYVYAVREGDKLIPTSHLVGKSNPVTLGLEK